MRALVAVDKQLLFRDLPTPVPREDQVLIRTVAAGLNRADLLQVAGFYNPPPGVSEVLGLEAAGIVIANADATSPLQPGSPVVTLVDGGAQAQEFCAPASCCISLPTSGRLDGFVAGAALLEACATAWYNLVELSGLKAGQSVLVHGGSGAVGSVAIALAKALGAKVVASAGSKDRARRLEMLGAARGVDYHDFSALRQAVNNISEGRGVQLILDVSGAGGMENNLSLLAPGGRLQIIGLLKGRMAQVDLGQVLSKNLTVSGSTLRGLEVGQKAKLLANIEEKVWPLVEKGEIRAVIDRVVPFCRANQAYEYLANKNERPFGKIVLDLTEEQTHSWRG